jgi:hypothetical protein
MGKEYQSDLSSRESAKQYALNNPEIVAEHKRNYARNHPERVAESRRRWRENNSDKHFAAQRESHLRLAFGITTKEYDELLKKQNGKCALCGGDQNPTYKFFDVDHVHDESKKVRGLLCRKCNVGLGTFENNLEWLKKALNYLGVTL